MAKLGRRTSLFNDKPKEEQPKKEKVKKEKTEVVKSVEENTVTKQKPSKDVKEVKDVKDVKDVKEVSSDLKHEELALLEMQKIAPEFIKQKDIADKADKVVTKLKASLKELFKNAKVAEFIVDSRIIKYSTSVRKGFDDEALIKFLKDKNKELKIRGLIKNIPVVDLEILEDAIYNKLINASDLVPFETETTSHALRVVNNK